MIKNQGSALAMHQDVTPLTLHLIAVNLCEIVAEVVDDLFGIPIALLSA